MFFSYWAGDDADVFGILFEPIVHVLAHSKQVVKAGSLTGRPVAFWHLGHERRGNRKVRKNGTPEGRKDGWGRRKEPEKRWCFGTTQHRGNKSVAMKTNLHFYTSGKRPTMHIVREWNQRVSVFHQQSPVESSSKWILVPELQFSWDEWIKQISCSWCDRVGIKCCFIYLPKSLKDRSTLNKTLYNVGI